MKAAYFSCQSVREDCVDLMGLISDLVEVRADG